MNEPERDVPLRDVFNLRDLGGYPTVDGTAQTRWRRLLRGAGLHRLAGADADTVHALGLRTVIDLRTESELSATGAYRARGSDTATYHLPLIRAIWDHSSLDPEAPEPYLAARYGAMLVEGRAAIVQVVDLLSAEHALPAVFFCAAGKDRTGVVSAVLLDAIGVEPESIITDYALSGERVARILDRARAAHGAEADSSMLSQPEAIFNAPPGAMRMLLGHLHETYGSGAGYLRSAGVSTAQLTRLAASLLEPA